MPITSICAIYQLYSYMEEFLQYLHITIVEDVPFSNMENGNKQNLSSILIVDILQKDLN